MTAILKPGLLVSLRTTLAGGIRYERRDIAEERSTEGGSTTASWETTRIIDDAKEHERASKTRGEASNVIRRVCAHTAFGLLCSQDREEALDEAINKARQLCDEHNASAATTRINVYVMKGRIAATDDEAARALANEVQELLSAMEEGIRGGDAKSIREAATKAKQLGAVLGADQEAKVGAAIDAARKAAREIAKRVEKNGEAAETVVRELAKESAVVSSMRFAFLDFEPPLAKTEGDKLPGVSLQRFAALDMG